MELWIIYRHGERILKLRWPHWPRVRAWWVKLWNIETVPRDLTIDAAYRKEGNGH